MNLKKEKKERKKKQSKENSPGTFSSLRHTPPTRLPWRKPLLRPHVVPDASKTFVTITIKAKKK